MNAGTQSTAVFAKPETVNLAEFMAEFNVNFTSFLALTQAFLPFLLTKKSTLLYTGTHLAYVPAYLMPGYSTSKAALNAFELCLREQLKKTSVRVVDISPPVVQSMYSIAYHCVETDKFS